jgi:hypothetical protein
MIAQWNESASLSEHPGLPLAVPVAGCQCVAFKVQVL